MKVAPGIRRTSTGFQAYVRVKGRLLTKRFKPDTTRETMKRWRELQRVVDHFHLRVPGQAGVTSFEDDVAEYLELVAAMPTFDDRSRHLHAWVTAFGLRTRASITAVEIRAQLERWRFSGRILPSKTDRKQRGLSPATLNLRRTALMHFFSVMNGRDGVNPVRGVPPYREPERVWTLPTLETAERAIAAEVHPRWPKKAGTKTQARLRVLLWTGWPSAILKQLRPEDVHWKAKTAMVHGRRKGRGTPPRTVPLSDQAIAALRVFDKLKAYGSFSGSSLHSALQRGCIRAKVRPFRVYDLRHRFITTVVLASNDERGAAELALHSDPRQTRRYSRQAASERATAALEAAFPSTKRA